MNILPPLNAYESAYAYENLVMKHYLGIVVKYEVTLLEAVSPFPSITAFFFKII